jgi:RNA binding activity-knot of a chromodomain
MKLFLTLLMSTMLYTFSFAQTVGSKVTFTAVDGKTYTGTIKDISNNQYKVKYDGVDFEAWLTRDQFKLLDNTNSKYSVGNKVEILWSGSWYKGEVLEVNNDKYKIHYDGYGSNWDEWVTSERLRTQGETATGTTSSGNTSGGNSKYKIGQHVEAWNIAWYKATVIGIGSGNYQGYIKVHYDDYSSASDQYIKESNIRLRKNTTADYTSGLSYGNITNPITIGYFDLENGNYTYYDAGKNVRGRGAYVYSADTKQV